MRGWIGAILGLFVVLPAYAQSPLLWVERADQAERRVALQGIRRTQIFLPTLMPEVEEHVLREGLRYRVEYRRPLQRQGEVLIDDGVQRFHYLPRQREVQVFASEQPLLLRRRAALLERLRKGLLLVEERGEEQVAGRPAVIVEVRTRGGTPLRRWWIDRQYGIILRMEEWTAQGHLRLRTEYVHLQILPKVPVEQFAPLFPRGVQRRERLQPLQVFASVEEVQPLVPFRIRQLAKLPPGFYLAEVRLRMVGVRPLVSLHYSDEAHHLALFQSRLPLHTNSPLWRSQLLPATRVQTWREGNLYFLLMGDVPEEVFEQARKALR